MTNFNDQYSVHMFPNKQLVDKVIDHKGEVLLQNHSQRFGFYHRLRSHRRVERGLFTTLSTHTCVCLHWLVLKLVKVINTSYCNRPKITLKCCWHRMEKNLQKHIKNT